MNLTDVKDYIGVHLMSAEADLKAKFAEVIAFVENKQAADATIIAAEVADLTARGYIVTAPADQPAAA